MPSKITQLRKKKARQVACGGSFVVAIGKDVSEKEIQQKLKQSKEHALKKQNQQHLGEENAPN